MFEQQTNITNISNTSSSDSQKIDYDKKIRTAKKEMTTIIKENQKLQIELKKKNEMINTLINQNFTELKTLQEKHDEIVNSISTNYENNIKNMENKYKLFRHSMQSKLKDNIDVHYKLSGEKINLLSIQHKTLVDKILDAQKDIQNKDDKIKELNEQYNVLENKYNEFNSKCTNLEYTNKLYEKQLADTFALYETQTKIKIENNKTITDLTIVKENLESELSDTKQELSKNIGIVQNLKIENEHHNNSLQDINSKYLLLSSDNQMKQNTIDEKTLENLNLATKLNEFEKKNTLLEANRKDQNIKITEYIHQIDNLRTELITNQKMVQQYKNEKETIIDEKKHYMKEAEQFKQKMNEMELLLLGNIKKIQDNAAKEKEKYISDNENKLKESKDKFDKQIAIIHNEYNTILSDREKQIDGLTSHLKSFTDHQYITLNEIEKIKLVNEKLRMDQFNIDQKINEINNQHKKEIDDLRTVHKKDKDTLIETYNEAIRKSQELNDAIQNRLNQTIEALGLSKTAISNLKETNQNLEKQLQNKESEDNSYQDKYNQIRSENLALREKLERSIELNNNFNNKEKQYESQIKQLHIKHAQLINLAKRGINSVSQ